MPATESVFMKSANLHRTLEFTDADGKQTVVEPYAIFTSAKGRRCYRVYQLQPAPEGGTSPWKDVEVASIASSTMRDEPFQTRTNYDPFDKEKFPMVHFSLPTADGRQRWADAPKNRDKQTITNWDRF